MIFSAVNKEPYFVGFSSFCVFLFFVFSLVAPNVGAAGAAFLLLAGIPLLFQKQTYQQLNKETLLLMIGILFYALVWMLEVYLHQLGSREYDRPSRFVFAVIALLFLLRYPPRQDVVWGGIALGAIATGSWALWEKFALGAVRVSGHTNAIQYGNLSMLMGLLCLVGLGWAYQQQRYRPVWMLLMLIGLLFGMLASGLSGSRGGWIGLPLILFYIGRQYRAYLPKRVLLTTIAGVVMAASIAYLTPSTGIKNRVDAVFHDVEAYQQGNTLTSVGVRFELWKGNMILIKEKPLFGWGEKEYLNQLRELNEQKFIATGLISHAHNEVLYTTSHRGIFGLMSLLLIYVLPIYVFIRIVPLGNRHDIPLKLAGVTTVFCYIDFGLTQAFFSHNSGVMFYPFALVFLYAMMSHNKYAQQYSDKLVID